MACKYYIINCQLLLALSIRCSAISWCETMCFANHPPAQLAMLRKFVPGFPDPPKGMDLLDWARQCVADGTVVIPGAKERTERQAQRKEQREAERAKLLEDATDAGLPDAATQIKMLGKHAKQVIAHYVKTRRLHVSDNALEKRLTVCRACPSGKMVMKDEIMRCKICGCGIDKSPLAILESGKAYYEALDCEHGHWK